MVFLSPWPERLLKIAQTAESLFARLDFDCEVRAWRVMGPPGATVLLGIAGSEPLDAQALEALRYYLAPRLNARLGLELRPSHLRLVNIRAEAGAKEFVAINSHEIRRMLKRPVSDFGALTGGAGVSAPAELGE